MPTRTLHPYEPDDLWLLPPSPRDWLSEGHMAEMVSDVIDELDLKALLATYGGVTRDTAPYRPKDAGESPVLYLRRGDSGLAADCP